MKYPFEKQIDLKDCGVCCLKMLTRYYGGNVSTEYLRNITYTTKDGVSAYSLIEGAKQLGFAAYGVKGEMSNLKSNDLPCIAHVIIKKSYQHFIIIYNIDWKNKKIIIADPASKGISKISFEEFNNITTNQFVLLKPYKKIQYIEKNTVLRDLIYKFISKYKKQLSFILTLSLFFTLLNIINSFQLNFLLTYIIEYNNTSNILFFSIIFGAIIILKELFNYYRNTAINVLNHELDKYLILNVYNRILSLPYLYYKNRTTGEIVARINDINSIKEIISKILVTIFIDLILATLVFVTLIFLSLKLTLILILVIILMLLIMICFQKPLEVNIEKVKKESSLVNSFLVETITAVETIRNQNIQSFIENNFLLKYSNYNKKSYLTNNIFIVEQFFKDFINQLGSFIVMIVGSYLVVKQELDLANLLTFLMLMNYLLDPIKNIIDINLGIRDSKISLKRLSELYEVDISNKRSKRKTITDKLNNISIKNLTYSYNGQDMLLKNINIEIMKSDKVLIYGSSGGGKSTLSKLLSKQLPTNNKQIYINNKDINSYSDDYHQKICYISQQEYLFTTSVYQNIVLDKEITYDKFLSVCKLCMIDKFIDKNILTYDMLLEENGFNISGGQRQRIILARSLLMEADIYILDESLNEVDIETERTILKNIFNTYQDKIFIVISHRFHNQDLFNKKYCIKEGVSYEK